LTKEFLGGKHGAEELYPVGLLRQAPAALLTLTWLFAVQLSTGLAQVELRLVPVEGQSRVVQVVGIAPEWVIHFQPESEPPLHARDVVRLEHPQLSPPRPEGPQVLLVNGERLRGSLVRSSEETVRVRTEMAGLVELPWECLAAVLVDSVEPLARQEELLRHLQKAGKDADEVWLKNGDRLQGNLLEIHEEGLVLESGGQRLEVPRAQLLGVSFNKSLARWMPPDRLHALVVLADGSQLRLTELKWEGRRVEGKTFPGGTVSFVADQVRVVEFYGGRAVYLSDLEPMAVRQVPYVGALFPYRRDQTVLGNPLSLRGQVFRKGLGVHSYCELVYQLDGSYRTFRAVLGVDDETQGRGSVEFVVLVDGQGRFRSPVLTGQSAPLPVAVDVAGARELKLVVDYATNGDVLDHADWADAMLIR
jgi:hypothetical protein